MLQLKKISVNLALVISLAVCAGVQSAQAENVTIPLPSDGPDVQGVLENVRSGVDMGDIDVKAIMRQTRDVVKEKQAILRPLMPQMSRAISDEVSVRVRQETRDRTMQAQMAAMMDPKNPGGVPEFIAPKFD